MSKTTVVYAHPYEKSFNHGILETVKAAIAAKGDELDVLDLYADGFNPVYQPQELAMFSRGEYLDPLTGRYHESLRGADRVIFIFPVWWNEAPAIVKGFFDKVMLPGFGYKVVDGAMKPVLDIAQTLVITTSEAPTELFAPYFRDYFIPMTLGTVGMRNARWLNCPGMTSGTADDRRAFLATVASLL